uniref:Tower domain-containing protein n=1 Tax=Triatoma dimidiata TaxID=72491 RepID=A0A0V0GB30_TRIDM
MISLINKGKVCVGSKLAIMGAESINPDQICDPLKVIKECRLKVCTNSCRRARWDSKMGFVNSPCLSSIQLSSVLPHGGVVGKTSALVSRVYPILHMSKDSEGKTVFRNERTQSVEEARYEKIYNEKAEELYEQVWREVEQKYKKNIDVDMYSKDINTLTEPDILWNIIEQTCDPATQGLLSNEQLKLVADYREQILSKMRQEVQDLIKVKMRDILPERHIVKLLKVRLVDCEKEIQALLTIWRPTEEICSILKENKIISFTHLCACGTRERVLQLTNTRQTRYQEVSSFASNKFLRRVTCLSELKPVGVTKPVGLLSSEIDVIGIVIYIKHPDHPKGLTIVYLTNLEGEYIAISFWTALKVFGCEDVLTEDSLVCCYNLQWRTGSGAWRIPNVFATELSVFTQHPKLSHLKLEFSKIKSLLSFEKTTDRIAEHKLQLLAMLKKREYSSVGSGQMEYVSTSENQADITPVQKKIRKLSTCGRPPPLAPLPLFSRSPEVLQDFRSPCRVPGSPLRSFSESNKS